MEIEEINNAKEPIMINNIKHHFVLVHGAGHGAWCWYKVADQLESAGHRVTALDLAAAGIDGTPLGEVKSVYDYVRPLMEVMETLAPAGERVVLAGHSLGGLALAIAMEAFPEKVSAAVFATAEMPVPNSSLSDMFGKSSGFDPSTMFDTTFFYDNGPENPPTSMLFGPIMLSKRLYNQCSSQDWRLATMLVRPVSLFPGKLPKDTKFTEDGYGSVARAFVMCTDDQFCYLDLQREIIAAAPVREVKEIRGADHMVMLSKPQEFSNYLLAVAEKYA